MLKDMKLRALKPAEKIYKVADQQGLYVAVTRKGVISLRFDYRVNGRRETLVIGSYDPAVGARKPRELNELDYGMFLSLAEARQLLGRAHRSVEQWASPSRSKVEKRSEAADALTFGKWAEKYCAEADLAESTRDMRKSVYDRNLAVGRLIATPSCLLGTVLLFDQSRPINNRRGEDLNQSVWRPVPRRSVVGSFDRCFEPVEQKRAWPMQDATNQR
jgi:Arm DNA-binding domain